MIWGDLTVILTEDSVTSAGVRQNGYTHLHPVAVVSQVDEASLLELAWLTLADAENGP
jgi:hypothetical protein